VVITVSGSNDGPVAVAGVNTAVEDGGVVTGTLSASDVDGDALSFSLNTGPSEGSVVVNADGSYSFDPGSAFQDLGVGENRDVSFSYDVSDGNGGVATENVVITVSGSNDGPVAVSGVNTAVEDGGVVTGTLSASDIDGDTLSYSLNTGPSEGSVVVNADGSYSFDPGSAFQDLAVGETRDVSFSYDVSDGNGGVATENVVITVSGSNDGPVAVAGVNTAVEDGGVVTGTLSASDVDGDALSFSLNTGPSEGSVVV
ncbi:hypothetical protein WH95_11020, partial [Kiloniella litopenaei]